MMLATVDHNILTHDKNIDRALQKIEAGTYGVCEDTGQPIPYERLSLIPWARTGLKE